MAGICVLLGLGECMDWDSAKACSNIRGVEGLHGSVDWRDWGTIGIGRVIQGSP